MDTPHEVSPGLGRRAVAILATVGFAFVIIAGGGAAVYYAWARLVDVVLAGAVLLLWAAVAWRRPHWRSTSALGPALALVVVTFAIGALLSRSPRIGLEYAGYAAILGGLYLLFRELLADRFIRARILAAVPALCGVLALAYIAIVVADWVAWWDAIGRLAPPPLRPRIEGLTYANPSTVMAMLMLLLASSIAFLGAAGRRWAVLVGLAGLALGASFLTGSRGGLIGLAVGVGCVALVAAARDGRAVAAGLRNPPGGLRRWAIGLVGGATIVGLLFGRELLIRLTASGGDLRVEFAMASLRQFAERPLTGTGPGLWPVNRVAYSLPEYSDRYIPHAHNIVAQTLAEFGIAGIAVGAIVALVVGRIVLDGLRSTDPERRRWGYASVFTMAYLVGHQQVDLFANAPAVMLAAAVPIAVLDAARTAGLPSPRFARVRSLAAVAWIVSLAVTVAWMVGVEQRALRYELVVLKIDAGQGDSALGMLGELVHADPDISPYQVARGLTLARTGDLAGAAAAFEHTAAFDDYAPSWINLAAVRIRLGQDDAARDAIERAMRLGYQHPGVAFAAGELWASLDERERAVDAFAEALARVPSLGSDATWHSRGDLASLFDDVRAAAYRRATPSAAWELAVATRDFARAEEIRPLLATWEQLPARLVTDALRGTPESLTAAWEYFDGAPLSPYSWTWAPRLAEAAGDPERARRYRAKVVAIDAFGPIAGRSVRIDATPDAGALIVNESNIFHGLYAYRRPLPQVQFVPWLSQLVWR